MLAADYDVQVRALPAWVNIAQELYLPLWMAERMFEDGIITRSQYGKIRHLDNLVTGLSTRRDETSRTAAAVQYRPEWHNTRLLAREVLRELGIKQQVPDLRQVSWMVFEGRAEPAAVREPVQALLDQLQTLSADDEVAIQHSMLATWYVTERKHTRYLSPGQPRQTFEGFVPGELLDLIPTDAEFNSVIEQLGRLLNGPPPLDASAANQYRRLPLAIQLEAIPKIVAVLRRYWGIDPDVPGQVVGVLEEILERAIRYGFALGSDHEALLAEACQAILTIATREVGPNQSGLEARRVVQLWRKTARKMKLTHAQEQMRAESSVESARRALSHIVVAYQRTVRPRRAWRRLAGEERRQEPYNAGTTFTWRVERAWIKGDDRIATSGVVTSLIDLPSADSDVQIFTGNRLPTRARLRDIEFYAWPPRMRLVLEGIPADDVPPGALVTSQDPQLIKAAREVAEIARARGIDPSPWEPPEDPPYSDIDTDK
jgi:hypothetical protein